MSTNKYAPAAPSPLTVPDNVKYQTRSIRFPVPESVKTPWFHSTGDIPTTLDYFDGSMVDALEATAKCHPKEIAYLFYGNKVNFQTFVQQIHIAARALRAQGVQPGDRVTICMPNTPQAIILFYAVNRMGAVANMIHPLSGEEEIVGYINNSRSVLCLTLLQFYPKFARIRDRLKLNTLLLCDITDGLTGVKKLFYPLTVKDPVKLPKNANVLLWQDFIRSGKNYDGPYLYQSASNDVAAILYSGGTTGTSKGILLSNLNFNALALQTGAAGNCLQSGHTMLSIMPVFHGFGLGVCIHTVLYWGGTAILIPQFNAKSYCKLLAQYKPNYIAGVPTLFEALLRMEDAQKLDMSQLEGIFSGGDSLSVELKGKVDAFLREHGAKEQIREGYGTTECVTASCLTPRFSHRDGSIGIPFPDTYYKIVIPSTHDEVPYGTVGEICLSGPTVMLGYMDNPKETAQTLQLHEDGRVWLHTGDLGVMDEDGFIYFKQRLKRMIITSGYNVYPSQVENVLDAHPDVLMSTVIGVKDDYKMQRVKAFVVPKPGIAPSEALRQSILEHCRHCIARYAVPQEIEFRTELPHTLVGKVAYTVLEQEEAKKEAEQAQQK
jgi:long-chain acyl-CoA synthetase